MEESIFIINQCSLPKKKLRGAERYLKKLRRNADSFKIVNGPDDWFDYWHYHVDINNMSSRKWNYRKEHIKACINIFHRLVEESKILQVPFQLWVMLNQRIGYNDAVFMHTPNPNSNDFPCKLEGITWDNNDLENIFCEYFKPYSIKVGVDYDSEEKQQIYYIYSPEIGIPLK